jgi:hypothetical protein
MLRRLLGTIPNAHRVDQIAVLLNVVDDVAATCSSWIGPGTVGLSLPYPRPGNHLAGRQVAAVEVVRYSRT